MARRSKKKGLAPDLAMLAVAIVLTQALAVLVGGFPLLVTIVATVLAWSALLTHRDRLMRKLRRLRKTWRLL